VAVRRLELVAEQAEEQHEEQRDELQTALAEGARAQNATGDLRASRQSFEHAYRLAEQAADLHSMAVAALGLAGLWVRERRTVTGAALLEARLQRVLPQLDAGSPLALRIRARLAGEADYSRGEHAAILAVLVEARADPDPLVLAEVLSIAHHCVLGPDHVDLRRELAAELTRTSFSTERRGDLLMGLLWQTVDSYTEGDPHAGRMLGELRDHLGQRGHLAVGFVVSAIEVMLAIRAGRFEEAESLVAICAENGAAAGDADWEWWSGAQLVTIRWYQGRLAELLPSLRDRVHSSVLSSVDNSSVAALAVAAALNGDRCLATSSLAVLCGNDLADLPRSSSWLVAMNGIIEAAYLLADADIAARAYELLRPYAHLPLVGGLGITCFGSAQQALGVAALTSNRLEEAIGHFRAAVQHNLALAHWPAVISSRQRLAQACALRGNLGDADAARRQLDAARSEATARDLPVPGTPVSGPPGPFAECERAGRKWRFTVRGRSTLVNDSIGMLHLAVLIANPRQEIHAADLVAGLAALDGASSDTAVTHPVLDRAAIDEYRNRLKSLGTEIDRLVSANDLDRAARARAERDWLVTELASAAGFGGRTRSFPDQGERARVAVGKAIRRALVRITEADPVIGEHLRQTICTGVRCSYWPG
jgi:hypothetical protein